MTAAYVSAAYLLSSILFILSIRGLASPDTARRGNILGMLGMAVAISVTVYSPTVSEYAWMLGAIALGGVIGVWFALKVKMTALPQMIAAFNGLGGLSSVFIAAAEIIVKHKAHILLIAEFGLFMLKKANNALAVFDNNEEICKAEYVNDKAVVNAHDRNDKHEQRREHGRGGNIAADKIHNDEHKDARDGDLAADKEGSHHEGKQTVLSAKIIHYREVRAEHDAKQSKGIAYLRVTDDEHEQSADEHGYRRFYELREDELN